MAEPDAEAAFLNSMQKMNDNGGEYSAGYVENHHNQSLQFEDENKLQGSDSSTNGAQLHVDALSPDTITPKPELAPEASQASLSGRASTGSRPKVRAGFIVDDEDDDEDGSGSNAIGPSGTSDTREHERVSKSPLPRTAFAAVSSASHVNLENASNAALSLNVSSASPTSLPLVSPQNPRPVSADRSQNHTPATVLPNDTSNAHTVAGTRTRLPHDRVGIMEDRIKEDPRGDLDAWLSLISEHRRRNKIGDARAAYDRFFKMFPTAAEQWVEYARMELTNNEFYRVEQIFNKSLRSIPNLDLWKVYLDYVRRRNNLTTDSGGSARTIVSQSFDFVLQNIGIDPDSGDLWRDYIAFVKSAPGTVGGSGWQDQQKMDSLRKAYQRAVCVPTSQVNSLWKEYDAFEMGLNKLTGRNFLQERSPAYMTARSSLIAFENITAGLNRTTLPKLPPAPGFDGYERYQSQVELWKRWIQWEKEDPLVLKDDDVVAYRGRILFAYRQALMALRFWPEVWYDAAQFCFESNLGQEGEEFLLQGMTANPESCLLAFARADRLEFTLAPEEGAEGLRQRGDAVREPYDKVLDALYDLIGKIKARENQEISRLEEASAQGKLTPPPTTFQTDETENGDNSDHQEMMKQQRIQKIHESVSMQVKMLSKTISFAWIALMRAMRRIQGKGKVGDVVGGCRQIFTDARKRGRLTSDVYTASALIEYQCYKDPAANKIFERGIRLFPEDEVFALEYLKHLTAINDVTNARAVFETSVSKLTSKPETKQKAKGIFRFFHQFESQFGELSQIKKLEKRMSDLYPENPRLPLFTHRFVTAEFDPMSVFPIVSPATQARPKAFDQRDDIDSAIQTPTFKLSTPKRQLAADDSGSESGRPRKIQRGDSPLKGAAGRRVDQQKRGHQPSPSLGSVAPVPISTQQGNNTPQGPSLPREIMFLLSIIPKAETYTAHRFSPEAMTRLVRDTNIPAQQQPQQSQQPPQPQQRPMSMAFVQSQPNGRTSFPSGTTVANRSGPFRYVR